MNPTFSSPVLTERCTYRWEDLEKAAQGVFTEELRAEQARLRQAGETSRGAAPGIYAVPQFLQGAEANAAPVFEAVPAPDPAPAPASAAGGFTVPMRDESGFLVRPKAGSTPGAKRPFFEPPKVAIPPRDAVGPEGLEPQTARIEPEPASADPMLVRRIAEETAREVASAVMSGMDGVVDDAVKTAADKIKQDLAAAVAAAVAEGVREGLAKAGALR